MKRIDPGYFKLGSDYSTKRRARDLMVEDSNRLIKLLAEKSGKRGKKGAKEVVSILSTKPRGSVKFLSVNISPGEEPPPPPAQTIAAAVSPVTKKAHDVDGGGGAKKPAIKSKAKSETQKLVTTVEPPNQRSGGEASKASLKKSTKPSTLRRMHAINPTAISYEDFKQQRVKRNSKQEIIGINLSRLGINYEDFLNKYLGFLVKFKKLVSLDLSHNPLGIKYLTIYTPEWQTLSMSLRNLNFSNTGLEGVRFSSGVSIDSLDLSNNKINNQNFALGERLSCRLINLEENPYSFFLLSREAKKSLRRKLGSCELHSN